MQRGIAYRRNVRNKKIAYRKRICEKHYGWAYYEYDGQYSKGKIHCGCRLCKPDKGYQPSWRDEKKKVIAEAELRDNSAFIM